MKVDVATSLDCSADAAWTEVQTSALLHHVIWPLARVTPVAPQRLPERWCEGETVQCRSYIFSIIPIGVHTIYVERVDQRSREITFREKDALVRSWDHTISITPTSSRQAVYRDVIDIDAGPLTILVWAWASWFYRHRQRRWRALARTL
jgi:hypothetical protein